MKEHIKITKAINGSISTIGTDIQAVIGIRRTIPEVGIESLGDGFIPKRNTILISNFQVVTEGLEVIGYAHSLTLKELQAVIKGKCD